MPITAWIATLTPTDDLRREAMSRLAAEPAVMVGELAVGGLPLVVDTASLQEEAEVVARLEALAGVEALQLVHADFSDLDAEALANVRRGLGRRRRHRRPV